MKPLLYLHKKAGRTYFLYDVQQVKHAYEEGATVPHRALPAQFTATDPIPAGSMVCFYGVYYEDNLTSESKCWARAADMFFDGRFQRVPRPADAFATLRELPDGNWDLTELTDGEA